MGNIPDQTVICKCLNQLNVSDDDFFLFNSRRKFTFVKAIKLLIDAQLSRRTDLRDISDALRANEELQQAIGLESISASQITRTLGVLPLWELQRIWLSITDRLKKSHAEQGIPGIGKLHIIDSTELKLPDIAGDWAYCSKKNNVVKIHTKLVVSDPQTVYPDRVICSTRGVADLEVALDLVVDPDAIHVMDRGYIVFSNYKHWCDHNLRFVARIQTRNKTEITEEREIEEGTPVIRDADVIVTYKDKERQEVQVKLRLVEYVDEKERVYRVLTNVWDLKASQICEVYRNRWMIELFFKWMKQHMQLVHLYSYHPDAVWNQIFLTLIAYGLVMLIKQESATQQHLWPFLKLLRNYMNKTWDQFLAALNREPTKRSAGRKKQQRRDGPPEQPEARTTIKLTVY